MTGEGSTLGPGTQQALVDAAGILAERRAQRPDADGFVTNWSPFQLLCLHEAGHAIVALILGKDVRWVMVGRSPSGNICGLTQIVGSPDLPTPEPSLEGVEEFKSDRENLRVYREVMAGGDQEACLAILEPLAEPILETHWRAIRILACELEHEGTIRRPAIERILEIRGQ